ncbi:MAG: sulfatase [Saprospiraceae bacterium]|nr:sulfatase [Saprospiraceae bacterium]
MKTGIIILIIPILSLTCHSGKLLTNSAIIQKPNILFILVDDLGYHDLKYTGSTFYETPNIDSLAKKSFVFTQGYATCSVCSPSRASIMTGKFTARHGITDWMGESSGQDWQKMNRFDKMLPADYVHELPKSEITLAEAMKTNGYTTFFAGKWHLGGEGSLPEDHGFEINKGGWDKGSPIGGYFSTFKNPKLEDNFNGENLSMRLASETVSFIRQNRNSSFFAFLSFYAVHGPIQTTEQKWVKYRDKADANGINKKGFSMERKLPIRLYQDNPVYGGLVESMDDAVGFVLQSLKDLGLDKNTIVIFTSDNGGVSSGDSFSTSNFPLRGGKGYQWEGGIREPFFIYVPWAKSEGKTSDYPVTGADFFPTILDYANIDLLPGQHKDGISLKLIIDSQMSPPERPLYWHYPHYGNQGGDPSSIIRKGDWKLIHYYEDNKNELYNLKLDPSEKNNVVSADPQLADSLYSKLKNWLSSVDARYPIKDFSYDEKKREEYDKSIREKLMQKLENERKLMLSKDFKPNADWWGSKTTKE